MTRFIVKGSIEDKIRDIQERKRKMVKSAYEWNEDSKNVSVDLSMNELRDIFS